MEEEPRLAGEVRDHRVVDRQRAAELQLQTMAFHKVALLEDAHGFVELALALFSHFPRQRAASRGLSRFSRDSLAGFSGNSIGFSRRRAGRRLIRGLGGGSGAQG